MSDKNVENPVIENHQTGKTEYHYCVIYTSVLEQDKLRRVLKEQLPEGRGTVFFPCMETYRRDAGGDFKIKAIFPGYIFIRSDMKAREVHEFIRTHRRAFMAYIRELRFSEKLAAGTVPFGEDGSSDDYDYKVSDLKEEEAEFLDFLLDIGDTGGEISDEAREALEEREARADGEAGHRKDDEDGELPTEGLLRMSYGYKEKGKWKVVKGPLRAYESHIASVNTHDKKAYLDFDIGGRVVRAGFDVKPKKYWFPEDEKAPDVLTDGTEVDLEALKNCLMSLDKRGK